MRSPSYECKPTSCFVQYRLIREGRAVTYTSIVNTLIRNRTLVSARHDHLITVLELHNLYFGGFVGLLHGYILLIDDLIYAQVR